MEVSISQGMFLSEKHSELVCTYVRTSGMIPFILSPTFAFALNTSISAIAVTASFISALFCDIV